MEHLIRRDLPLEQGRKLAFVFTVAYEVTLDEDFLNGEQAATLDELEDWLGGKYRDSEQIYRALAGNYYRRVVEHEVTLDDRYEGADEHKVRFEGVWEAREREAGREDLWASRKWLAEVPPADVQHGSITASAGPDAPTGHGGGGRATSRAGALDVRGTDKELTLDEARERLGQEHPTAAEVMERDG